MNPADIITCLGATTPDLSARLRTVNRVWSTGGSRVTGYFHFLALRDGKPTINELVDIAHKRIVNFALPRWRILEAVEEMRVNPGCADPWVALSTEARDLFLKTHGDTGRSGELGEILLFMLVEWVLHAPIVACKMYLKTNQQMPVHGQDAIHLGYNGNQLVVYWGESKLHATLSSAIADITQSISGYHSTALNRKNEIRIMNANVNFDDSSTAAKKAFKAYFNPYSEASNMVADQFACLAGFDSTLYDAVAAIPHDQAEAEFTRLYEKRIDTAWTLVSNHITNAKLTSYTFHFFLLPFESVDSARALFQVYLSGQV